jgi:hypothetical protein
MANPPAFDYGNLLTAQARGNYRMQPMGAQAAQAALGNTQNWAGLASATSASSAQRDAAMINAAANTAQQGIASYGNLASSVVNAYGGIAQQGISAKSQVRQAELAIEQEKERRGSGLGAIAGAAVGLAGLFIE